VTFEQPWWLLAALPALPLGWVGWRWLAGMSSARRWSAIVLRALLMALIAMMLAGASAVRTTDRVAVVVAVDASDSARLLADRFGRWPADDKGRPLGWSGSVRRWIEGAQARRIPDDLLGVISFDGAPLALEVPTSARIEPPSFDQRTTDGTDIAAALGMARAMFPAGASRRIVLISDGNQTTGDAAAAAEELAAAGVRVDVIPLAYSVGHEVIVESVDAPPQARQGATVPVRVVLRATDRAQGTLELLYEGRPLDINGAGEGTGRRLTLEPGRTVETIDVPLAEATLHRFEPVFVPDNPAFDQLPGNNRSKAFTVTPGKGRVLMVDGVSGTSSGAGGQPGVLARTLDRAGIETLTVAPEQLPDDLLALNAFDLIVLENVPAEAVARGTQALLADYVTKLGGGLVMVGGPDSFGAGGWKGTPLEAVLPVRLDLPEDVIAPPAAVALVLDNSGSMRFTLGGGSMSKQQIANESAALAIRTLDKTDVVCVIGFNTDPEVVIPAGRNTDSARNADAVRAIGSGGGTHIAPALALAGRLLDPVKSQVKHVILLTDGQDEQHADLGPVAADLRKRGMTVSTIGVGDDVDEAALSRAASMGGGKFYRVADPSVLPRIFVKEVRITRKPLVKESPFTPRLVGAGSPLVESLGSIPQLGGLVLTRARPGSKAAVPMVTPEGDPVLAHWVAGRGQVAAFTSDAHRWAARWLDWPGYEQFWTRLVRAVARPSSRTNSELTVQALGDTLKVRLDAADDDGKPMDMLSVPGTVYTPDGSSVDIKLSQTGPGTYEASTTVVQSGQYIVALSPSAGARRLAPLIGGTVLTSGPELRNLKSNIALMERIARITGGRVLDIGSPETSAVFDRSGLKPTPAATPLWRTLLVWSVLVLLLDIGTRKVAWDRLIDARWRAAVREYGSKAVERAAERAAATVAGLRQAVDSGANAVARSADEASPAPPGLTPDQRRDIEDELERARREQQQAEAESRGARLRERLLRAKAGQPDPRTQDTDTGAEPGVGPAQTAELLKAKRRAHERFEQE